MPDETVEEIARLKQQIISLENVHQRERSCLLRVVKTYEKVVDRLPRFAQSASAIKTLLDEDGDLPTAAVEEHVNRLRARIYADEIEREAVNGRKDASQSNVSDFCRLLKRLVYIVLDGFYPLPDHLKQKAGAIQLSCSAKMDVTDLHQPTQLFLEFVSELKNQIFDDLKATHNNYANLLEQLKALEETIGEEFAPERTQNRFDRFKKQVDGELGLITNSFELHTTIEDIKGHVLEKLESVRRLLEEKKKADLKQVRRANARIEKLMDKMKYAEARAMQTAQKLSYFRKAATTDGLTGLLNRSAFDARLKQALDKYNADGRPFAVVLLDIDKFKWINDTFGHPAGDKVLKAAARSLIESFRKNDAVSRFGGDEFAVLVEDVDRRTAQERVEIFRSNFKKKRFFSQMLKKDVVIEVSAGVTEPMAGDVAEKLMKRADAAMYEEKRTKTTPTAQ